MGLLRRASYPIDRKRLRVARLSAGLSQTELASKAGYTARLIRKAEKVGRLSGAAIEDILQALNEHGCQLSVRDLCSDDVSVSVRFLQRFLSKPIESADGFIDDISDEVVFHCAGGESNPWSGTFVGAKAFADWHERFHAEFERGTDSAANVVYLTGDRRASILFNDQLIYRGRADAVLWINLHLQFGDRQIERIDYQYDTQAFLNLIRS